MDNTGFSERDPKHYHGDIVRVCFFIASVLMLLGLPYFQSQIPLPISASLGAIVLLIFLAGLTNPIQVWFTFIDTIASLVGVVVFEYFAVSRFESVFNCLLFQYEDASRFLSKEIILG